MNRASAANERQAFSARLTEALEAAGYATRPAEVVVEFNKRTRGTPVTIFAVRKWLNGDAIPTQDKLHLMASWLGVPAQWLRFGDAAGPGNTPEFGFEGIPARERRMLLDILSLDEPSRLVVEDVIASFVKHFAQRPPDSSSQGDSNEPLYS